MSRTIVKDNLREGKETSLLFFERISGVNCIIVAPCLEETINGKIRDSVMSVELH